MDHEFEDGGFRSQMEWNGILINYNHYLDPGPGMDPNVIEWEVERVSDLRAFAEAACHEEFPEAYVTPDVFCERHRAEIDQAIMEQSAREAEEAWNDRG